ncbi:MAG TPA: hypothetical protein VGI67_02680 [Thermoleophilaceae bacterium]
MGARNPVLKLKCGSTSDEQKPDLIWPGSAAYRLSDVGSYRICGAHGLHPAGPEIHLLPPPDRSVDLVRQLRGKAVHVELLETLGLHTSISAAVEHFVPPHGDEQKPNHQSPITNHPSKRSI